MRDCPICQSSASVSTVSRSSLPIFQNVVWDTVEEAMGAPSGRFLLATCPTCGFSYNGLFDAAAIVYDEHYDNSVPSAAFKAYYQSLIDMLIAKYGLATGIVYDVGCGKGEFLEMLCLSAPGIRGVGIDPSCQPVERGNFSLINDILRPEHFGRDAKLVIVRHVLEHIADPVAFMSMIRGCVPDGVPVFVEVPDLDWILTNDAFWDFCYEHCNYFTIPSLKVALEASGFTVIEQRNSFGEQYQWALCQPGGQVKPTEGTGVLAVETMRAYLGRENHKVEELAGRGPVAVWGMATKGVILSLMLGRERVLGGIDVNPAKQGKYAAGSGVGINAPEWATTLPRATTTLVMNPNYAGEIAQTVRALGAEVNLVSA